MVNDGDADGGGEGVEGGDHLGDGVAALAGNAVLVKVGQLLELGDHLAEDKLQLVMLLDLAALRNVDGEPLGEQLKYFLGQLPDLLGGLVLAPAAAVQDDLSLVDVVIVGVLGVAGDGMGK